MAGLLLRLGLPQGLTHRIYDRHIMSSLQQDSFISSHQSKARFTQHCYPPTHLPTNSPTYPLLFSRINPLIHSPIYLFTHPLTHSIIHSATYLSIQPATHSLVHLATQCLTHPSTQSPTHSFTHTLTPSLTQSLAHPSTRRPTSP